MKIRTKSVFLTFIIVFSAFISIDSPGEAQVIAGCQLFPEDNIWNTPIDTLPVHANSDAYVATIGAGAGLKADFGSGIWPPEDGGPIGIPFDIVPGNQPGVEVIFDYDDESDPGPYPIPDNPQIEGGPDADGDRHILMLDEDNCTLYELYYAYPAGDGTWTAGSGAIYDLSSNELRPDGWTSADAAGLPILPGLVRYDEVASGEINHAIRFTVPETRNTYVWPARHYASNLTGAQYPPMGMYFRLRADYDISGFSEQNQVILRALKTYGMILADNGSAWYMSGVPDERWDNDMLQELGQVKGADFEAVDVSSLMVDPDSGQTGDPGDGGPTTGAAPVDLQVSGSLTQAPVRPTFRWRHQTNLAQTQAPGEWYNLYILDNNQSPVVDAWLPAAQICTGVTCEVLLSEDISPFGLWDGQHTWRVRAWANNQMTAFSNSATFTVDIPAVSAPGNTRVNPDSPKPYVEVTFDDDPGTTWVQIYVGTQSGATAHLAWYPKPDDCPAGTCHLFPFVHLVSGSYVLWMQTWGPGGNASVSEWEGPFNFNISFDAPGLIEPLTPANTNSGRPTFSWTAQPAATWYHLWTGTEDFQTRFDGWFWSIDLGCEAALTCTTVPNMVLDNGTYTWWMQSWGPGGFSTGGENSGWVEGDGFAVSAGSTGTPEPLTPTGTINDTSPTFMWQAIDNASWYELVIETSSGAGVYSNWQPAEALGCETGICSWPLVGLYLEDGAYRWAVRAYSPGGIGNRSAQMNFTVMR